jgi:DNA-binding NarL/FixJ family response regulator
LQWVQMTMENVEKRIRIFLADDHRLTRRALKNIFDVPSDIEVVAEAENAEEVFQKIPNADPDVLVLDLNMPDMNGLEILRQLRSGGNNVPVVILTLFPPEKFKDAALKSGAASFLSKDCNPEELIEAVRKAKRI